MAAHLFEFSDPTSFKVIIGREWDRATAMPQKNRESSHEVKLLALLLTLKIKEGGYYILLYQISISYHIKLGNLRFDPSGNAKNIFSRNIYIYAGLPMIAIPFKVNDNFICSKNNQIDFLALFEKAAKK